MRYQETVVKYLLLHPAEKKHILYKAKSSNVAGEMDFTYYNAVYTVENALAKVKESLIFLSPINISPSVISSRPAIMRKVVVLLQPDGPKMPTNSPSLQSRL